jgi:hypothetical protein
MLIFFDRTCKPSDARIKRASIEALNKSILDFSGHGKRKRGFHIPSLSVADTPLIMALHPCSAETLNKSEFP